MYVITNVSNQNESPQHRALECDPIIRMAVSDCWYVHTDTVEKIAGVLNPFLFEKYGLKLDPVEFRIPLTDTAQQDKYKYQKFTCCDRKKIVVEDTTYDNYFELFKYADGTCSIVFNGYIYLGHIFDYIKVGIIPKLHDRLLREDIARISTFLVEDDKVYAVFNETASFEEYTYRMMDLDLCTVQEFCEWSKITIDAFIKMMSYIDPEETDSKEFHEKFLCPPSVTKKILSVL